MDINYSSYLYGSKIYKNCRNMLNEEEYDPRMWNEKMMICFNRFNRALEYSVKRYVKEF